MDDDIEAPSFSLGLDFDDPHTQTPLIVHDSDPEFPDPYPNLPRLRRGPSSSSNSLTDQHLHIQHNADCTGSNLPQNKVKNRTQNVSNAGEPISTTCNSPVFSMFTVTRFQLIDSDLDSDHPCVSDSDSDSDNDNNEKCNPPVKRRLQKVDESSNLLETRGCVPTPVMDEFCEEYFGPKKHECHDTVKTNESDDGTRSFVDVGGSCLPAHRYYFHDDPRIQELVRSRLPNFSPLGDPLNKDLDRPSTSNIDYMRQFSCGESSSGRKFSRKSKAEETSQGWVNPKLGVNKTTTKRGAKRNAHQTPGRWLTGSDGKKVYVGKSGQELTGRVAYMRYTKESGREFKKGKRKSATKKKKKKKK